MSDTLVLCYHAISPDWPAALSTTQEAFARQLRLLERLGYSGATFSDAVAAPGPGRTVAVTFDDGYASVAALARPVLDALGWPATVFVPTDYPGTARPMAWPGIDTWVGGAYEHELCPMSWDDLRDLARQGWEIGSHTCSHPRLTTLDAESLARELSASRETVEAEIERPCAAIAYPYGDTNDRVAAAASAAGYSAGAALSPVRRGHGRFEEPRVGVWNGEPLWRVAIKMAKPVRRLREAPGPR